MLRMPDFPIESNRKMVSIEQARALAAVSRRTIYYWMHSNKIEYIRTAGGAVRIYADILFRSSDDSNRRRTSNTNSF